MQTLSVARVSSKYFNFEIQIDFCIFQKKKTFLNVPIKHKFDVNIPLFKILKNK